jgi:hypothetical protein
MSQMSWERCVSATYSEALSGLRRLAEPRPAGDRVKSAIARAARRAGLTYWRAYDIWYGKARRIDADELSAIVAAGTAKKREARDDLLNLAEDFSILAERVSRVDPEMAGPFADAMRDVAGRARRLALGER